MQRHIRPVEVNSSDNIFFKSSDFCIRLRRSDVKNQQSDAIIKTISLFMGCFKYISTAVYVQHMIQS